MSTIHLILTPAERTALFDLLDRGCNAITDELGFGFAGSFAELDALQAPEIFDMMGDVMSVPPSWAPDLPLKSEGGYAYEYSK
jgi:hypothetical protein